MIQYEVLGTRGLVTKKELSLLSQAFSQSLPHTTEVSLVVDVELASSKRMLLLNEKYRGRKESTDVLSFPLLNFPYDQDLKELNLGSIVIDPNYPSELAVSVLDLIFHGTLHLLGFDHEADSISWQIAESATIEQARVLRLLLNGIPNSLA